MVLSQALQIKVQNYPEGWRGAVPQISTQPRLMKPSITPVPYSAPSSQPSQEWFDPHGEQASNSSDTQDSKGNDLDIPQAFLSPPEAQHQD